MNKFAVLYCLNPALYLQKTDLNVGKLQFNYCYSNFICVQ